MGELEFQLGSLSKWFSNLNMHWNHLESLLKHRWLGPTTRFSDSVDLGWGPRICILSKLPGAAAAAGRGPHFEHQLCIESAILTTLLHYPGQYPAKSFIDSHMAFKMKHRCLFKTCRAFHDQSLFNILISSPSGTFHTSSFKVIFPF